MTKALFVLLAAGIFLLAAPTAKADVTENRRVLNPTLIQENNGTMYLSTEAENDELSTLNSSPSSATSTYSARQQLRNVNIGIPRGFAATFSGLLNGVLSFVLIISALLVLFYLLWGGFDWITSGGDKGKTEKARSKIVAAVVGLIIVAASFAVLNLVIRFLGFSGLNDVFDNAGTINGGATLPTPLPTPTPTPLL